MKQVLLATIVIFSCCTNSQNKGQQNSGQSDTAQTTGGTILGAWRAPEADSTEFAFYKDSVYYAEENRRYKYDCIGDQIYVHRGDEGNDTFRYKIDGDNSLTLISNYGTLKYIRMESGKP